MISFNSKIVNIGALLLIVYLYCQYNKERKKVNNDLFSSFQFMQHGSRSAMNNFSIPSGKKYKDFSLYEKFMYNLYKDNIPDDVREKIEE